MEGKILIFNRWDLTEVKIEDAGLVNYINLIPIVVPRSGGKYATTAFHKGKMNIVERFMNKMMVPGHRGKKHKITSGKCVGNTVGLYNDIKAAFEIIEKRTSKNPVQVLVGAIENAALMEEVAAYRMGGIIARQAVIVAPQRRLDMALRHLTQGIYKLKFRNKTPLPEVIANELMAAYNSDAKSFAIQERSRIEKEAEGAR
jgi:small subunit ribosomal protein S7